MSDENMQKIIPHPGYGLLVGTSNKPVSEVNTDALFVNGVEVAGPVPKTTVFNADGTISETLDNCTVTTEFNNDGSIAETYTYSSGIVKTKTTTFTGSTISETVVVSEPE